MFLFVLIRSNVLGWKGWEKSSRIDLLILATIHEMSFIIIVSFEAISDNENFAKPKKKIQSNSVITNSTGPFRYDRESL